MKKNLVIVTTHPIQYYAPVFKILSDCRDKVNVKVFYTWGEDSVKEKFDPGFGKVIEWDLPLLEGYQYEFLINTSTKPGSSHFKGIITPDAAKRIEKFEPDAILVYGWANHSHLNIIRHFEGKVPIWFRGDSNLIDQRKGWKEIARNFFLKWVYSKVDKAFYVGKANKKYFQKYGLKENQLVFAPHSIDNDRFSMDRTAEAFQLRQKLGITQENILVLFCGKFEPKKDPEVLLNAFAELNMDNVHLLFVGNGILEKCLKTKVSALNLQQIHFLPFQNQLQMPVIYQSCNLYCLPSQGPGETWGLAVNEAMAAGKAVIVSTMVGCATDLVKNGENGFIFESGDKHSLKRNLKELCTDRARLDYMGKKSLTIIQDWSFHVQAKAILTELNGI
ncbi:glycosyltransferase family 4 protein [Desertivirga xinjiangensis]|uniref:glycosyltransferase family 4 protein n=1 Tax=Desertivirga xinjiangensis TaxID=539206 RepID=UPI0021095C1C|nr:glycosyltransferase family 4 protein [Pedobacter xinjiangensis]